MSMAAKPLGEMLDELPSVARQEVEDFTSYLWERYVAPQPHRLKPLKFGWAGALKYLRDQYTSVGLQHKIKEMWEENVSDRLQHPAGASSGKGKGR